MNYKKHFENYKLIEHKSCCFKLYFGLYNNGEQFFFNLWKLIFIKTRN